MLGKGKKMYTLLCPEIHFILNSCAFWSFNLNTGTMLVIESTLFLSLLNCKMYVWLNSITICLLYELMGLNCSLKIELQ